MSIIADPVTLVAIPGFTLTGTAFAPQEVELYELGNLYGEMIQAVRFSLEYGGGTVTDETYALQLVAPTGDVLFETQTPPITKNDGSDLSVSLCWSRLGVDTGEVPMLIWNDSLSGFTRGWANVRLPDLVLPPRSKILLQAYRGATGFENDIVVSDGIVSTNRIGSAGDGTVETPPPLSPVTGAYTEGEAV